eukprot:TRINITY_DN26894_c0_g2_i1.p1 TRINITY_DN26894_c0_g2~~TRINITY_DN26894_c0_g2_i1.p1  ORF type:complete len:446 (+),score=46.75 TRINITY_DN26894_c0_g2_i1:42-1340(+)
MTETIDVIGMACSDCRCDFRPHRFRRRAVGDYDVLVDVKFCGVCHSDLHAAADHYRDLGAKAEYPMVPGHEIAGVCTQVGSKVTKFKVGDHVGIGCMIDSCLECWECCSQHEQFCTKAGSVMAIQTYGGRNKFGRAAVHPEGSQTMGGYSNQMVVHEHFAVLIPMSYPLEAAGPVMCSGITMYEPLKRYGAREGTRVGVIGLGGLGCMGIKIARELKCRVTAISRGRSKKELASKVGADLYVDSLSIDEMRKCASSLDIVLNTIPIHHDTSVYEALIASGGNLVLLGVTPTWLAASRVSHPVVTASLIGGMQATQEVVDICAQANIVPEIKVMPVQSLNEIYQKLDDSNDSGVRFVVDLGSLSEDTFNSYTSCAPTLRPAEGMRLTTVAYEMLRLKLRALFATQMYNVQLLCTLMFVLFACYGAMGDLRTRW